VLEDALSVTRERESKTLTSGYGLAAGLFIAGSCLFAAGALAGYSLNARTPDKFGLELAKALLTLGSGLILGGAVKILLDRFQASAKEKEEERAARERLLADLRLVHDRAESARLLIAAHRSAKTYGEQMRDLIGCQVVLLKVKRILDVRRDSDRQDQFTEPIAHMVGYLRALQEEYRDHYKTVSDCQRYDEQVTKLEFERAAKQEVGIGDAPPSRPEIPPASSQRAWQLLDDECLFPMLDDLSNRGERYRAQFQLPLHKVASGLLGTEAGSADTGFDDEVAEQAQEIRSACRETSQAQARIEAPSPA
jgi:hypothetical protein